MDRGYYDFVVGVAIAQFVGLDGEWSMIYFYKQEEDGFVCAAWKKDSGYRFYAENWPEAIASIATSKLCSDIRADGGSRVQIDHDLRAIMTSIDAVKQWEDEWDIDAPELVLNDHHLLPFEADIETLKQEWRRCASEGYRIMLERHEPMQC